MIDQSKTGPAVISYLLLSSLAGAQLGGAFYKPQKTQQNMLQENHFLSHTWHFLTFLHPILMCRLLSTGGDALIMLQFQKNPDLHKKEIK
jgi:hypothetical protein